MQSLRLVLRRAWRLLPDSTRGFVLKMPLAKRLSKKISGWRLSHDEKYTDQYYDDIDTFAVRSQDVIAQAIVEEFHPTSVVDVGCGTGALLYFLKKHGVRGFGLEYSEAGLQRCRERGVDVKRFDLLRDTFSEARRFDVAISMEVAEHLVEKAANRYVALLCQLAPNVVFTAAPPGQPGLDHVNLQPREYWIEKFAARGFKVDQLLTERWLDSWKSAEIDEFFYLNLIVFRAGTK